ncbi:flavohemoprotein [Salinicoccus sp. ID82-1]|uniref:globin domain-containing protein n=1 Tax=Salinicoccus sp. ID82-1 TaxID=2820269 RepID=UPI001F0305EB|nr:globin domain-containing protein [Salinicoccus sp. ID82-1]MCG1008552.1 flavohemoprotein [Salinicoccus sp. ID82-1]
MITEAKKDVIKATIPVLEAHGTEITTTFYQNMFVAHPELLNIFNQTNQKVGNQPKALAMTVLAAAKHIDNLEAIVPHVVGIAHKHRALEIKPEHYPIVGKHLLEGIQEVLGDQATPEIIDAWGDYYNQIAQVFIDVEQDMYQSAAWDGFRPFTVKKKEFMTPDIVRFTVDSDEVDKSFTAGQYITVKVKPADYPYEALRHYSICSNKTVDGITFAVKREGTDDTKGVVSNYMHDEIEVGDALFLSAPAGDFKVDEDHSSLLFIAGGVGATPVMAMAEEAIAKGNDVKFLYSAINETHLPFKDQFETLEAEGADIRIKFSESEGYLNREDFVGNEDREIYICGSMVFMNAMITELNEMGVDDSRIHFEPFGPKMSLQKV